MNAYIRTILVHMWMLFSATFGILAAVILWRSRNINRYACALFSWGALKILRMKIYKQNCENLNSYRPCVYMINHQSSVDIALIGTFFPSHTYALGKKELLWIPLFGLYFWASGNIFINRQNRKSAINVVTKLAQDIRKRKASTIVFPEGTRNKTEQDILPFKKGVFHMAIEAQVPIVPIVFSCTRHIYNLNQKIWKPGNVYIRALDPIPTAGLKEADIENLMQQVRNKMLENYQEITTLAM